MTEPKPGPTLMPLFIVQLEVDTPVVPGGPTQNNLDRVVYWHARMSPEAGLKLIARVKAVLQETLPGALMPVPQSAERALEVLGKERQLPLLRSEAKLVSTPPEV